MNDTTSDHVDGTRLAAALAQRANVLAMPAPEPAQLRELAEHEHRGSDRPAPVLTRRLMAAAVVTVLAAGGAYAVVAGRADTGSSTTITAAGPGISAADLAGGAPVVLRRIAAASRVAPAVVPRLDQFVYTKLVGVGTPAGSPSDYSGPPQPVSSEMWVAQAPDTMSLAIHGDGTRVPINPRVESDPGTDVQMATYADLAKIPTDPAGLRTYLDERFPRQPLRGAELLLQGNLVPPALASAIYQLLADEPGLTVDPDVADATGRPGVGIGRADRTGLLHELIFDRDGLQLIGMRQVRTDPTEHVVVSVAFVGQAIVDAAGDRPR